MVLLVVAVLAVAACLVRSARAHDRHRAAVQSQFTHRIHVNGIRGKSSVTRLVAGALREGGIATIAKTTGTAARLVVDHDTDIPVERPEANIAEQRRILAELVQGTGPQPPEGGWEAVVFECMAINPAYQRYLEEKVMHSTVGVITNVRHDHMDLLGDTLPEIAANLCATVPHHGDLVTAETDPEILAILAAACEARGTKLHAVGDTWIDPVYMAGFAHDEHTENVAVALKVAEIVGVSGPDARRGMHLAAPDPGAHTLRTLDRIDAVVHWANLFAVNDPESFTTVVEGLVERVDENVTRAVVLNNRADRPERVQAFTDLALHTVGADVIITLGDHEAEVARLVARSERGDDVTVVHLGTSAASRQDDGDGLLDEVVAAVGPEALLIGAANLHTRQATALLDAIDRAGGTPLRPVVDRDDVDHDDELLSA